MSWKPC